MTFDDAGGQAMNQLVGRLLCKVRERYDMDVAWMSSFDRDEMVLEVVEHRASSAMPIRAGDHGPLDETLCAKVLAGELPSVIPDVAAQSAATSLSGPRRVGIGAYMGAPVVDENHQVIGMVCCANDSPKVLGESASEALGFVADLTSEILAGRTPALRRERELRRRVHDTIDRSRFHMVFQPVVSLDTGCSVGAEALARFDNSDQSTEGWFTDAQSVGMAPDLELAAIACALEQLPELPPEHYLAINASPGTLDDPRLTEAILDSDPRRIVLEITEHDAVADYAKVVSALERLRSAGVRIAVDDVGAGFSSFTHVLELCPHFLKLDISITRGIDTDPARRALAHAAVEVADKLGATVVAEGVETPTELAAVASVGISAAQGYLFAHPAPLPLARFDVPMAGVIRDRSTSSAEDPDLNAHQFELAMLYSPIGICLVDTTGAFLHVNPALAAILGHSPTELLNLSFQDLTHPDDLDDDLDLLVQCLEGTRNSYRIEKRYVRADGRTVWADLSVVAVRNQAGAVRFFVSQIVDLTERHRREEALAAEARTDHLTGLVNRNRFEEILDGLGRSPVEFGLLFCDISGFKGVNDRYGHAAGDEVLCAVAQRIRRAVRGSDTVARWGGDEFVVIMPGADSEVLEETAHRIRSSCDKPLSLDDRNSIPGIHVEVGTARRAAGDATSAEDVLRRADLDMYHRRAHDNRVHPRVARHERRSADR
ncbi:MAG: EAL domain-containing protein [Microthrixaceae bacterium]